VIDVALMVLFRFVDIITSPIFLNLEMLWTLIPVYVNWLVVNSYQEKRGTPFGNAVANGFVCLWTGMDWTKTLFRDINSGANQLPAFSAILPLFIFIYGVLVIIQGFRGKRIAKYIGRVREVSYFIIVLTPLFYGLIEPDVITLIAILVFFPPAYLISELIARFTPALGGEEIAGVPEDMEVPEIGEEIIPETETFSEPVETKIEPEPEKKTEYACPYCKQPLTYLEPYKRYYCYSCKRYV
jgi:hypothetical protein